MIMKRAVIYWFLIALLWVSLLFLVFENSVRFRVMLSNIQRNMVKVDATDGGQGIINGDGGCAGGGVQKEKIMDYFLIPNCEAYVTPNLQSLEPYFVNINSDGFRGREYSIEKSNNTFRIIVLGDSFTFGWGLNLEETYAYRLEKMLNEKYSEKKFEVLNFGVPGMNTAQEIKHFKEKALKYDPDLVIIGFFYNDDETAEMEQILLGLQGKQRAEEYMKLRNNKELKSIMFVKESLEELINIAKKSNFKILIYALGTEDYQDSFFKNFEKTNKDVFFQKVSFDIMDDRSFYLHPADPHPSALANEKYAQEIYKILNEHNLLPSIT